LKKPAWEKHSSSLKTFINYGCKRFKTLVVGQTFQDILTALPNRDLEIKLPGRTEVQSLTYLSVFSPQQVPSFQNFFSFVIYAMAPEWLVTGSRQEKVPIPQPREQLELI
jgi:hypothetical protein